MTHHFSPLRVIALAAVAACCAVGVIGIVNRREPAAANQKFLEQHRCTPLWHREPAKTLVNGTLVLRPGYTFWSCRSVQGFVVVDDEQ